MITTKEISWHNIPQAESFLSVSQKKQKQDCLLVGDFNMISKLSFKKISTLLGWCSFALLLVFIANIAIGKYMHLKKMSIVSPINGVEEFLLFGLIIILFSCCSLLKEYLKEHDWYVTKQNREEMWWIQKIINTTLL